MLGCEDIYMAQFVNPPLTTVKLDRKYLGKMAFDVLERMSRSKQRKGSVGVLETQLIIRSSTAARNHKPAIGSAHSPTLSSGNATR